MGHGVPLARTRRVVWPPRLTPATPKPRTGAGSTQGSVSAKLLRTHAQTPTPTRVHTHADKHVCVPVSEGRHAPRQTYTCACSQRHPHRHRHIHSRVYQMSAAVPHWMENMSMRCVGFDHPMLCIVFCRRWPWFRWSSATTSVRDAAAATAAHSSLTPYTLSAHARLRHATALHMHIHRHPIHRHRVHPRLRPTRRVTHRRSLSHSLTRHACRLNQPPCVRVSSSLYAPGGGWVGAGGGGTPMRPWVTNTTNTGSSGCAVCRGATSAAPTPGLRAPSYARGQRTDGVVPVVYAEGQAGVGERVDGRPPRQQRR
jgi:hypothetical protein